MKTIQTELQKIADAIKGAESEEGVKTTQDLLAEIRDNIAGTTPSGEVKNMQVLLGEIAQAISDNPPSPEPETFAVAITMGDSAIVADKTYSEIMTAINSDSKVVFSSTMEGETIISPGYYVFINALDPNDKIIMIPLQQARDQGKIGTIFWGMNSNNEIQMITLMEVTQP